MGYYIQTPDNQNKAEQLARIYGARRISQPITFEHPPDKVIICVVQNGPFDAAAVCYNAREFEDFAQHPQPKKWLLIDKVRVVEAVPNVEDMLE